MNQSTNKGQKKEEAMGCEGDTSWPFLLTKLSIELNDKIKEFERQHNANIIVSNMGYRHSPERFPSQEKLQLFNIYPDTPLK